MTSAKRLIWLVPPLLAAIAYRHVPEFGLVADISATTVGWSGIHEHGWSPFNVFSWQLEQHLFGDVAGSYHVVQVLWHLVAIAGVLLLATAMNLTPPFALAAGTLYGLHPAAIEPVCLLSARPDVVSACAVIWGVASWVHWQSKGKLRWLLIHIGAVIIALMSNDNAVIIVPLLSLWWALKPRRKVNKIAPLWITALLCLLLRYVIFSEIPSTTHHIDTTGIWATGAVYLQGLIPLRPSTGIMALSKIEVDSTQFLLRAAVSWGVLLGFMMWFARKKRVEEGVLLCWLISGLATAWILQDISVPGDGEKYAAADRWLLQSAASTSILFPLMIARTSVKWLTKVSLIAVVAWSLVVIATSEGSRGHYRSEVTLQALDERRYQHTPLAFRTNEDNCKHIQRKVTQALKSRQPHIAEGLIESSRSDCREKTAVRLHYVEALFAMRRSRKAQHDVDILLRKPPTDHRQHGRVYFLAGVVSFDNGYPARAIKLLQKSSELDGANCDVFAQLGRATASLHQRRDAHKWFERALTCQTRQAQLDPGVVVAAAFWNVRLNKRNRAKQLLKQANTLQLNSSQQSMVNSLSRQLGVGSMPHP